MDDGGRLLPGVLLFAVFIILSVTLHIYRAALLNISEGNVEKEAENGNKTYRYMYRLLEEPFLLDSTIQFVTIVFGMVTGLWVVGGFSRILYGAVTSYLSSVAAQVISWTAILLVLLFLSISVGYLAPQKIGTRYAQQIAWKLTPVVRIVITVLTPVTFLMNSAANAMVRLFGVDPSHYQDDVTEDEIRDMVDEAHEQGVILESEAEMIQNIMEFGDKTAHDIMTHRKNVNAIEADTPLREAMEFMLENSNTRYPVYRESIDHIIGIIHLKDAAGLILKNCDRDVPVSGIENLIRGVGFIPETRNIDSIFKTMQAKKVHLAVVIDEYGQTSGIVTMEDILEEIVGNILDEYDDSDDFIELQFDNSILMDGFTPLDQAFEVLGIEKEDLEYETLNGYLTSILEHIPTKEDVQIETDGYCFHILRVEDNIIQKLRVTKIQ